MTSNNRLKRKLDNEEVVIGARGATFSETIIEVYGDLGLDYVWLDFEHAGPSPYDSQLFESLVRTAASVDLELLVRLPSGDPPLIRKVLDAGVRNLLIPRVQSVAELRAAVSAGHFEYDGDGGKRGSNYAYASDWGRKLGGGDYVEQTSEDVLIGPVLEEAEALASLEEMLAVPRVGFAMVGPYDLSTSLGHPLEPDHPEVRTAVDQITEACDAADVPVGLPVGDGGAGVDAVEDGYDVVWFPGEIAAVRKLVPEYVSTLRNHLETR